MANFDIKPPTLQSKPQSGSLQKNYRRKRNILAWWEILILIVVFIITSFLVYVFFFATKAKKQIFQPKISSAYYYKIDNTKNNSKIKSLIFPSSYVSFLFLGIGGADYPGGSLTDSIQVVIIDKETKDIYLVSLPRDLWVNNGNCGYQKINTMFWCGESYYQNGGQFAKDKVSEVLGIPINYYVRMDFEGFRNLIDTLGGLDINVEKDFNDYMAPLYLSAGWHHLDGATVLNYARSRYTDSDFDRSRRQQQVIMSLKDKFLQDRIYLNPFKIYQIVKILADHLRTDAEYREAISYIGMMSKLKIKNNYVIDNRKDNLLYSTTLNGAYVLLPIAGEFDYSKIQAKVKEILNL